MVSWESSILWATANRIHYEVTLLFVGSCRRRQEVRNKCAACQKYNITGVNRYRKVSINPLIVSPFNTVHLNIIGPWTIRFLQVKRKIKCSVQALTMVRKATSQVDICELSMVFKETDHVVADSEEEKMYVSQFIKMQSFLCTYWMDLQLWIIYTYTLNKNSIMGKFIFSINSTYIHVNTWIIHLKIWNRCIY